MFNNVQTSRDTVLVMRDISKRFPGVIALDRVSLDLASGEVLALVGENGAGKSTLMKILSGAYSADSGSVTVFGREVLHASPHSMMDMGVAIIYQELLLAKDLSVAENIYLGRLPRTRVGTVDWPRARRDATAVIDRLGFDISPDASVGSLSVAHRQIVEIAKALSQNARIIVLDEPSAVLGDTELKKLFGIIRALAKEGVSFIYISHRLSEVFEISDRAAVMRDGRLIGVERTVDLDRNALVRMMVGRELTTIYPERSPEIGETVVDVEGLSNEVLRDVSLRVRKGEIVGICGLAGAGRTEVLRALCGADAATARSFVLNGHGEIFTSPKSALECGVGLVPEDRRHQGLFIDQTVGFNISIAKLATVMRRGLLSGSAERAVVDAFIERLHIKAPGGREVVANLSGGNQQKCVLAKLLNANCAVLLIDEPTRGVDIGAKREIYQVLADLADKERIGVVIVSSELPEILGMCDRIYVMRSGEISGHFSRADASEEKIMHAATA